MIQVGREWGWSEKSNLNYEKRSSLVRLFYPFFLFPLLLFLLLLLLPLLLLLLLLLLFFLLHRDEEDSFPERVFT